MSFNHLIYAHKNKSVIKILIFNSKHPSVVLVERKYSLNFIANFDQNLFATKSYQTFQKCLFVISKMSSQTLYIIIHIETILNNSFICMCQSCKSLQSHDFSSMIAKFLNPFKLGEYWRTINFIDFECS